MKRLRKHSSSQVICQLLTLCEDIASNASTQKTIRGLAREIEGKEVSPMVESELMDALHGLKDALRHDYSSLAETCLKRASMLIEQLPAQERRRERMSLIKRIKAAIKNREDTTRDELLANRESDASSNVYVLEKKIAELSDRREALMKKLREKAEICSRLDKTDPTYDTARREALTIQPQIKTLEQQIKLYSKTLQNNTQYRAMLQAGSFIKDLEQFLPDTSEAEAVLETISEHAQDLSENIDSFGESMEMFEKKISTATHVELNVGGTEFDQMIDAMRDGDVVELSPEQVVEEPPKEDTQQETLFGSVEQEERKTMGEE